MTAHRSEMEIATKMHPTVKIMTIFSLTRDFNFSRAIFCLSLSLFLSLSWAHTHTHISLFASFCLFGRYLNGEKVSNERDDTNNEKHDYINSAHKLLQPFVSLSLPSIYFLCQAFGTFERREKTKKWQLHLCMWCTSTLTHTHIVVCWLTYLGLFKTDYAHAAANCSIAWVLNLWHVVTYFALFLLQVVDIDFLISHQ